MKQRLADFIRGYAQLLNVATYWPDSFENKGSYALVESVGMVKGAEMLFCAYEQAEWEGFEGF